MEKKRADRWNECVILLQKNMRRFITRIHYMRTKDLAQRLQQVARQKVGKRKLELLRQERAVVVIQKYCRGFLARKQLQKKRDFILHLQAGMLHKRMIKHRC